MVLELEQKLVFNLGRDKMNISSLKPLPSNFIALRPSSNNIMDSSANTWKWLFPSLFSLSTTDKKFNPETMVVSIAAETKKDTQVFEKELQDLERWRSEFKLELESMF
jgi:hypothetical protein